MRYIAFLLALLWIFPAQAAVDCHDAGTPKKCQCVAVVFHRPAQSPPDDLQVVTFKWAQIARFNNRMFSRVPGRRKKVAAVHFFYRQFGLQGGPTSENMEGVELSLTALPATTVEPREGLYYGYFAKGLSPPQSQAWYDWFFAPLDDTEDVVFDFESNHGAGGNRVLAGSDVMVLEGVSNAQVAVDGFNLGLTIRLDILENGC